MISIHAHYPDSIAHILVSSMLTSMAPTIPLPRSSAVAAEARPRNIIANRCVGAAGRLRQVERGLLERGNNYTRAECWQTTIELWSSMLDDCPAREKERERVDDDKMWADGNRRKKVGGDRGKVT